MKKIKQVSSPNDIKESIIRLGNQDENNYVEVYTDTIVIDRIMKSNTWPDMKLTSNGLQVPNFISEDYKVRDVYRYSLKIKQQIELFYFESGGDHFPLSKL